MAVQITRTYAATATTGGVLAAGKHTPVDAANAAITMFLPTPVNAGAYLSVEKVDASANTVTISGSIRGASSTITLVWQYETVELHWTGTTWRPVNGHKTKTALDATYASLATAQTITAQHTFSNGLKIGPMTMQPYPNDLTGTVHANFALMLTGGLQMFNDSASGKATRIPFNLNLDINAANLAPEGKAADKVGAQLNVNFRGDFTNEAAIGAVDPGFLWGADDFITTGSSPGDLKGVTDLWGRETETHLMAPGVHLGTLKGLHTEVAVESSAVGSHVDMMVGHHITNMKINGSPAGTTVDSVYGLLIEAPLQGTTRYGLYITDQGKARIGGDLEMNQDPSQPHTINAYSGSVFGQTVHIGKPTDMPVVSGGESRLAVYAANDTDVVASFATRGNATGDVARFGVGQYVLARFDHSGRLVLSDALGRGAVPDAELAPGEVSITVDGFPMKLNFRGRDNSGAIRTASIALA